jgi:hypothetical protein
VGADGAGWETGRVDGRARWLVPAATAGLATVLLGLTAAAVLAAASADRAVREAQHLSALRDAWVEARYQVSQEHSIAHAYLAKPGPKLRPALGEASRALDAALRFLAEREEPDDAVEARRIQARHAPNLQLVRQMLDVVDRGDLDTANEIHCNGSTRPTSTSSRRPPSSPPASRRRRPPA